MCWIHLDPHPSVPFWGAGRAPQCCAELPAATPASIGILLAKYPAWEGLLSWFVASGAWWPCCSRHKTRGFLQETLPGGFTLPAARISKCGKSGWCLDPYLDHKALGFCCYDRYNSMGRESRFASTKTFPFPRTVNHWNAGLLPLLRL